MDLLDPEFQVLVVISFKSKKTAPTDIQDELQMGALQEQTTRPALVTKGRLETGQIGGHPSISWTAERNGADGKVIRYTTWVQSENTRGSIAAAVPAEQFDRFRERFQAIINSFRMP